MKTNTIEIISITPNENMHLKNIISGDIFEGIIYLGVNDSAENYTEVSEEEYQVYLNAMQNIEE